jgi:hypothetical protein
MGTDAYGMECSGGAESGRRESVVLYECLSDYSRLGVCLSTHGGQAAVLAGNTTTVLGPAGSKRAEVLKHVTYHTFRYFLSFNMF